MRVLPPVLFVSFSEYQCCLHQMIDRQTLIVEQSKTVLDHHYCTHLEHVMFTSVPSFGLSDHNPTILACKQNLNLRRKKQWQT